MRVRSRFGLVASVFFLLLIQAAAAHAQQFELLSSFSGCPPEGCGTTGDAAHPYANDNVSSLPQGPLVAGPDGNLYGTSPIDWRAGEPAPRSWGTIFRVSPGGAHDVLHHFSGVAPGGCGPGGIGFSASGVLHGVGRGCSPDFTPTIFRVVNGVLETVQEFPAPGVQPLVLVASSTGIFHVWGTDAAQTSGNYRWDETDGTLTSLGSHGARMVPAPDGNVYVPVAINHFVIGWFGWIVRLADGVRIHDFPVDEAPSDNLIVGTDGNLYGFASHRPNGLRPYRLTPGGAFTYLGDRDIVPVGMTADGSLYCFTASGGDAIVRFRNGTVTPVHTFDGSDGSGFFSPLTRGADGHLYGIRSDGGEHGLGVLYRLRMPTVDLKANGLDGPITVGAGSPLQISMAFDAASDALSPSEVYLAVVTPGLQIVWTTPSGFSLTPAPIYSGPLPSFPLSPLINIPDAAVMPAGDYYWVAIVDADSNGVPNGHYVDVVKTTKATSTLRTQRR